MSFNKTRTCLYDAARSCVICRRGVRHLSPRRESSGDVITLLHLATYSTKKMYAFLSGHTLQSDIESKSDYEAAFVREAAVACPTGPALERQSWPAQKLRQRPRGKLTFRIRRRRTELSGGFRVRLACPVDLRG